MKFGPFPLWIISPFTGVQLWSYYVNASAFPGFAVEFHPETDPPMRFGSWDSLT